MSTLILAPHPDDEVLGVGGTIAALVRAGESVCVAVLTGRDADSPPVGALTGTSDAVRAECREACDVLGVQRLLFRDLPPVCLDHVPAWQVNDVVRGVIEEVRPETLYVPFAHDLHRDHAAIAYAASVATRPYLPLGRAVRRVLAYETLSETHLAPPGLQPAFEPNVFVDISDVLELKLEAMSRYVSQLQDDRQPRSLRGLRALAELRGSHVGVTAAEAFVLLRELG